MIKSDDDFDTNCDKIHIIANWGQKYDDDLGY